MYPVQHDYKVACVIVVAMTNVICNNNKNLFYNIVSLTCLIKTTQMWYMYACSLLIQELLCKFNWKVKLVSKVTWFLHQIVHVPTGIAWPHTHVITSRTTCTNHLMLGVTFCVCRGGLYTDLTVFVWRKSQLILLVMCCMCDDIDSMFSCFCVTDLTFVFHRWMGGVSSQSH